MKKFHRSQKHKMIAGVAGGVGEYFEIDPALVRLAFIVLLSTWLTVAAYIIAWIFIPLAKE
ncbi:MAG TPA: PspC domain-containing protein [Spirochaetota bacterium]